LDNLPLGLSPLKEEGAENENSSSKFRDQRLSHLKGKLDNKSPEQQKIQYHGTKAKPGSDGQVGYFSIDGELNEEDEEIIKSLELQPGVYTGPDDKGRNISKNGPAVVLRPDDLEPLAQKMANETYQPPKSYNYNGDNNIPCPGVLHTNVQNDFLSGLMKNAVDAHVNDVDGKNRKIDGIVTNVMDLAIESHVNEHIEVRNVVDNAINYGVKAYANGWGAMPPPPSNLVSQNNNLVLEGPYLPIASSPSSNFGSPPSGGARSLGPYVNETYPTSSSQSQPGTNLMGTKLSPLKHVPSTGSVNNHQNVHSNFNLLPSIEEGTLPQMSSVTNLGRSPTTLSNLAGDPRYTEGPNTMSMGNSDFSPGGTSRLIRNTSPRGIEVIRSPRINPLDGTLEGGTIATIGGVGPNNNSNQNNLSPGTVQLTRPRLADRFHSKDPDRHAV